jgi:hypothetical protein
MKASEQKNTQTLTDSKANFSRLPCRGCLADCTLYAVCEGRPWKVQGASQP